ncbi:unnamed protein product [Ranitomeya imitator]|uniref:Secreted protein n=1 Tax=Ranitomeya imitator TaxID=111125 RepID=A0ABN9MHG1_9NEOB|nr:unnamed protein product [Ranitomeya imitator]
MVVTFHRALYYMTISYVILYCNGQTCRLDISELHGFSQPGNITLGVVLPLHLATNYHLTSFTEKPPRTTCSMFTKC